MTDADAASPWSRIQDELRRAVDQGAYDLWLAPLRLRSLDGAALVLTAPDERRRWVAERFGRILQSCAADVLGPSATVEVVGADDAAPADTTTPGLDRHGRPDLNPKLTFDQFVIGDANHLAHGAALAVSELPGTAYNPLFIYGPPGVGKTHLLHSIANFLVAHNPDLQVRYTTAERFTNEFVAAIRERGGGDRFKGAWRRNDVLLIDDVQFLESKARTEEEFFHTFNELYEAGAQIVLTSDRPPRDLDALQDRLRERFEAGLVTDVHHPDRVMRLAILRKRAHQDGIALPDPAVLDVIASRVEGSVRELEGALIRVVAFASLTGRELTPALADDVLSDLYPRRAPQPGTGPGAGAAMSIERIQQVVCEAYALTREDLLSASRRAAVAGPRQLAMYLAREHTGASLPAIGAAFGGRNHTTVLHALRRIESRLTDDRGVHDELRALVARLRTDRHD